MNLEDNYVFWKLEQFSKDKPLHKTFGRYFLLLSAILLISPFFNPLANPLNNPNTQFENYPEPLKQFYSERLFTNWESSHQSAYAELPPTTQRIASPDDPSISDRELTNYGNGTFKQTIGVPMYVIDDVDSTYKDSYKNENSTHIQWINAENPIVFKSLEFGSR